MAKTKRCPNCIGRGLPPKFNGNGGTYTCNTCGGSGEVPNNTPERCPICHGSKMSPYLRGKLCPRCSGIGYI